MMMHIGLQCAKILARLEKMEMPASRQASKEPSQQKDDMNDPRKKDAESSTYKPDVPPMELCKEKEEDKQLNEFEKAFNEFDGARLLPKVCVPIYVPVGLESLVHDLVQKGTKAASSFDVASIALLSGQVGEAPTDSRGSARENGEVAVINQQQKQARAAEERATESPKRGQSCEQTFGRMRNLMETSSPAIRPGALPRPDLRNSEPAPPRVDDVTPEHIV